MKTVERERPSGVVHSEVRPVVAIVDDDASIREALRSLIASAGYVVRVFASAREFLSSSGRSELACVLLDAQMHGLSGLGLQRQLADMHARVPIIFVTASATEVRARALAAGAAAVVGKPFNGEQLLRIVARVTRAGRGGARGDGATTSVRRG